MGELERTASPAVVIRPRGQQPVAWADIDFTISGETAEQLLAATPENTRRAYDRNWGQFGRWCAGQGRAALPATPQTLAEYVRQLTSASLAPATIEQAIGTIRSKHRSSGYKDQPDTAETLKLLRMYKHTWTDAGGRTRKAKPVLIDALRAMVKTCDPGTLAGKRDRSLLLTGFNGMCRRSELAGLDISDIAEASDEGMVLYIRYSKTDQSATGAKVSIPYGQHRATCAVRATRTWIEAMAERGVTEGPLFRPVDRHGRVGDEPLAAGHACRRLTGKAVSDIVHRHALLAGVADPGGYTGHSLRSGAATSAYLAGAPVAEIAKHGRWSETSPVVLGYIRAVDEWKNNPMKGIGL
jgi:integrase